MPDLLASISLLPLTPVIPGRAAPIGVPAVADFMAMLGELVLPPADKPQGGKGQGLAGGGKNLPVEGAPAVGDEEKADPLLAWLPAGLLPIMPPEPVSLPDTASVGAMPPSGTETVALDAPLPTPIASPLAEVDLPGALPGSVEVSAPPVQALVSTPIAEAGPIVPTMPDVSVAASASTDAPAAEAVPVAVDAGAVFAEAAAPEATPRGKVDVPARDVPPRPVPVNAAVPQPIVPGAPVTQTAAQVFAAAISATFDSPAAPPLRTSDPVAVQAHGAAAEQLRTTVQAMSGADQPPLDLSRDGWTGKMIDRIATLRDAAEATDTRIRLAPENLGNVDVSIRRDGDRLHVHFAAENPATRQMLAEAAPRLAELADARGVKLGQTSVDAGSGGQRDQSNQPQSNQPARPASANAGQSQSDRDDRVA